MQGILSSEGSIAEVSAAWRGRPAQGQAIRYAEMYLKVQWNGEK